MQKLTMKKTPHFCSLWIKKKNFFSFPKCIKTLLQTFGEIPMIFKNDQKYIVDFGGKCMMSKVLLLYSVWIFLKH